VEENPTGPKRKLKETVEHMEKAASSDSTVSLTTKICFTVYIVIIYSRYMDIKDHHGFAAFQNTILSQV